MLGAATGSRGTAIGIASALAALCYLISSLAPVVDWIKPLRFASLFYWAVANRQLRFRPTTLARRTAGRHLRSLVHTTRFCSRRPRSVPCSHQVPM